MGKKKMKETLMERQKGKSAMTGVDIKDRDLSLLDAHRPKEKSQGHEYGKNLENACLITPPEHMEHHGNLRERTEFMEKFKATVDDRTQIMKVRIKISNQLKANDRETDHLFKETREYLTKILKEITAKNKERDKEVVSMVHELAEINPLVRAALKVKGVGEITVAYCMIYIDLEKARHVSSVWKYAGLHAPSHERYVKGVKGGGNKTLRTALRNLADSQMKHRGPYRDIYDRTKDRLETSDRIVHSRNVDRKWVDCKWSEAKASHKHGAALRKIMKAFLADWWYYGRTLQGLPTDPVYAESVLEGNHRTVLPFERGWPPIDEILAEMED